MNIPYTYLIYCIPTKQFYYGVRYSKNCHPNDLWKTYYTSSTYVRHLIKEYGKDSFKYEVRRTFTSSYKAKQWETKVLKKMNVTARPDFINKSNSGFPTGSNRVWITNGSSNLFIDEISIPNYPNWKRGKTFSDEVKRKISEKRLSQKIPMKGKVKHTKEQKHSWSISRKGRINGRDTSKPVFINDVEYKSIIEAMNATGLSRYIIIKYYLPHLA